MLVLDASAAVDHLLGRDASGRIAARIAAPGESLHAPHVVDLEVANAVRRLVRREDITERRAEDALDDYNILRLERYPALGLLARIWELRSNMTAFDAAYVALAEALEAPVITTDSRLARAPGHHATIELLA